MNSSDLTKPVSLLTYANTVGVVASTVYLNNKTNSINARVTDLAEDVESIRDGVKEKVPGMEKNLTMLNTHYQNMVNTLNNQGRVVEKMSKVDKKFEKMRLFMDSIGEALEALEDKHNQLVTVLKNKGSLDASTADELTVAKAAPVKVVKKAKRKYVSESEESESSEEEPPRKSKKSKKEKKSKHTSDDDEDDISQVIRMASQKKHK